MPNSPLQARVTPEGTLEITIGTHTLLWAASCWSQEESAQRTEGRDYSPLFVINDEDRWADEVRRELMREDEAGDTLLTRALDKAFAAVLHHGSCAITERETPTGKGLAMKCPKCGGGGFFVEPVCCGNLHPGTGMCCCNPEPAQIPCRWCEATGSVPDEYSENSSC